MPIAQLRGIHQKPEIAEIAGQQHSGFTGVCGPVNRPILLGKICWARDAQVVCDQPNLAELSAELRQTIGSFAFEVAPRFFLGVGAGRKLKQPL